MKRFILLLFSFLITFSLNYSFAVGGGSGGSGNFVNPPPGIPACSGLDAPSQTACTATEICDMHGYCGTTSSSYTVDTWSNLTSAFCGSIENNSFLTFTAEEPSITIDVYVYNCRDDEAIQVFLFEANNCSGGPVTGIECGNHMYAQNAPYTLSANGLVPGNEYYIMIDGFAGDVCDYSFVAGSGVSLPTSVDVPDITLCMGETVTVTASGGDGNFTWDPSPNLSSTTGATVTITPPTTPGVYTYNVHSTSTSNCGVDPSVATVTVTVDNCGCPVVASNSGPVCEGDLFDLQANFTGNITSYFWEGPNGFTSADLNPTGITPPSASGSYEYTIFATVDGIECQSSTTVTVTPCPNGCNLENIRATYAAEGLIEIETCVSECSMYFLNTQSMSGSEAQNYAESLGANLVSIQSQEENDCLLAGLNSLGQTGTIWIGLNDEDVEGTFVWYDQSPVTYTNWAPGEPNNSGGNEDCVQIYPTGSNPGMWNDLPCNIGDSKSIIEVNLCPVVNAGPDITICEGETAVMQSTETILGSAPYTYQWDNGGPSTYENSVTPSTTTEYVLTSEDQFGCIGEDAMTVEVIPLPVVNAGNDVTICEGEIIILNGSGEGTWDHGVVNGVPFEPTSTQTYTYTVTNNGCTDSDQVTVTVRDLPKVGVVPSEVWGCGNLEVDFTNLFQETGVDYTINFGNGVTETITGGSITHNYTQPGCYDVTVTASLNGCENTVVYTDLICITELPVASFYADPGVLSTLESETNFINTSQGTNQFLWDFGDYTAPSSEHSPTHVFPDDEAGTYIVTLVAGSPGCTDTATAVIEVEGRIVYYIPNSFTPDGDMYNPTFKPIFTTGYDVQNYSLYIYNRWGELIFESHDAEHGWDGTYGENSEEILGDGVYIYKIEFKTTLSDERRTITGHVTLIR